MRPMFEWIKLTAPNSLVGAEIGVCDGANARDILSNLPVQKIYLIDPYMLYKEYGDIKTPLIHRIKANMILSMSEFTDKVLFVFKKSSEAAADIPSDLDFVYIDGNHAYEFVKQDIENYWPKIKKGGVIGGHDYKNQICRYAKKWGVEKAVDEFAAANNLKLHTLVNKKECDWWIVKD